MKDAEIAALRKLLTAWVEHQAKVNAIVDEVIHLLAGDPGIGVQLRTAEAAFNTAWSRRYPGRYVWRYTQDRPHMKRLIKALGLEEFIKRTDRYLANSDPFYVKTRHSFSVFVSSINALAESKNEGEFNLEPPSDCSHKPPCETEASCTMKRARDLRL